MIAAEVEADVITGLKQGYNSLTELGDRVEDGAQLDTVNEAAIHEARTLIWKGIDKLGIGREVMSRSDSPSHPYSPEMEGHGGR